METSIRKQSGMPCKDFTTEDIICICSEIARSDNLLVQLPNKRASIFRRSTSANETEVPRKTSIIARKLSLVNGIPCEGTNVTPESPRIEKRKFSMDASLSRLQKNKNTQSRYKGNVPGLHGRDIVAVAILVDNNGTPIRTYTEHQDIPGDEIESAGHIFLSRIPVPGSAKKAIAPMLNNNENVKTLEEVLEELDENKRQKILKKTRQDVD